MAELFTADGVYTDNAFELSWKGPENIASWIDITRQSIGDVHVEVLDSYRVDDWMAVVWEFSGTDLGVIDPTRPATNNSFTVPAGSTFQLDGTKIASVTDTYNLANLLRQAGLPADAWSPPDTSSQP